MSTTKLPLTIDQLALAVFSAEYSFVRQRQERGGVDEAIARALDAAKRVGEMASERGFAAQVESQIVGERLDVRVSNEAEHAARCPISTTPSFLAENGYETTNVEQDISGTRLNMQCGAIVWLYKTGTAIVQGKTSDADRKALVELLRVDGWKVKG
jgi:hypothetical protein